MNWQVLLEIKKITKALSSEIPQAKCGRIYVEGVIPQEMGIYEKIEIQWWGNDDDSMAAFWQVN